MKKLILIVIVIVVSFSLLLFFKPMSFKYLTGTARVLEKEDLYQLKIDNKTFNNCIFKSTVSFDKKLRYNFLILYLKNSSIKSQFEIIVINIDEKVVGYSCSGLSCYDQILGNLIQSDMGSFYTIFEDPYKGPGFNTNLKIENKKIDFFIPIKKGKKAHFQLSKK